MRPMKSFSEVIDAFGVSELARLLDLTEVHVRIMKTRDSIPPDYWGKIVAASADWPEPLSWENLADIRASRFSDAV